MIGPAAHRPEDRSLLLQHAELIAEQSLETIGQDKDRRDIQSHLETVRGVLKPEA